VQVIRVLPRTVRGESKGIDKGAKTITVTIKEDGGSVDKVFSLAEGVRITGDPSPGATVNVRLSVMAEDTAVEVPGVVNDKHAPDRPRRGQATLVAVRGPPVPAPPTWTAGLLLGRRASRGDLRSCRLCGVGGPRTDGGGPRTDDRGAHAPRSPFSSPQ